MITYTVIESGIGEELGTLRVDENIPDENLLEALVTAGYLEGSADHYDFDDGYPFTDEGQRVVVGMERREPVLILDDGSGDADEDYDEDDDDPDDGDEEDDLL